MAASNKQSRKTDVDQQVVSLGEIDDSLWDDTENQPSPALGEFAPPEDFQLHQFGDFTDQLAAERATHSAAEPTIPPLDASNDNGFLHKEVDSQFLVLLQRLADRRLLLAGLLCSVILHLLVGGVLINLEPEVRIVDLPVQVVQVRLLPEIPLLETQEESAEVEEVVEEIIQEDEELASETLAEAELEESNEPVVEELTEQLDAVIEEAISEELIAESVPEPDNSETNDNLANTELPISIPSLDSIQTAIQQDFTEQQSQDRSWASSCTNLQRQSGVVGCVAEEEPSYAGIEQSPESRAIYNFHNPVVERSRTERTLSTIAANSGLLAANLANAEIPEGMADFMMSELERNITLYSSPENRVLNHMNELVDQSDAALITRSLFDPWVRLQIQRQQERRYLNRQDRQRIAECGSLKIFVLAATELEKFADCITTERNLLLRLGILLL